MLLVSAVNGLGSVVLSVCVYFGPGEYAFCGQSVNGFRFGISIFVGNCIILCGQFVCIFGRFVGMLWTIGCNAVCLVPDYFFLALFCHP